MSISRFSLLLLLAVPLLAGCLNDDRYSTLPVPGVAAAPMPGIDASITNSSPEQAQRGMSDHTWFWTRSSPAQIHYSTADGRDFVWLVGERRILAGQWRVDTSAGPQATQICLRYPGVNRPDLGSSWLCRPAGKMFIDMQEREAGDPLRFAGRTQAQFVLTQTPGSLAEVEGRVAGSPVNTGY
jgi:hypothetical protein